jgi:hypothetical protein
MYKLATSLMALMAIGGAIAFLILLAIFIAMLATDLAAIVNY